MPWFKSYQYRYKFTISNTNVDSDLADFPVALHINSSCGTGNDDLTKIFDIVGAGWTKLCVCAGNQLTPLWTEVDLWDADNETGILHVRVPKISSSTGTELFLYFDSNGVGNGFIGATGSDAAANVWDDNFMAVYHMGQDPSGTAPQMIDSSGNERHLTTVGSMVSGDLIDSEPGKGLDFNGSSQFAENTTTGTGITAYPFTLEAAGPAHIVASNASSPGINIVDNSASDQAVTLTIFDGYARLNFYSGTNYTKSGTVALSEGVFCHIAATGSGSTDRNVFTNGADKQQDTTSVSFPTGIDSICAGGSTDTTPSYWPGEVSEARFSDIVRADAWIKATYYTLADSLGDWDLLEGATAAPDGAWLGDWKYRKKISIPYANIDDDLVNFPLALRLSAAAGELKVDVSDIFDEIGANSHKIAVTDHTGVRQLYVEIDCWNNTDTYAFIHIGVPHVSSEVDTILYFYYDADKSDNDGYVGDPGDTAAQNVWDEYFMAVYHFNEAPTVGGIDSTRNGNTLSHINMDAGDVGEMFPGKGWTFGPNELAYDDTLTGAITDYPITMEVMGFYDGVNVNPQINYCRDVSDSLFLELGMLVASDVARANLYSGATYAADGTVTVTAGDFVCLAGRWESKDLHTVFTNGADKQSYTNADKVFPAWSDRCLTISGRNDFANNYYEGQVSEARVSSIARSDGWIAATSDGIHDTLVQWTTGTSAVEFLSGFANRIKLTIDGAKVGSALSDFPITLFLNAASGQWATDVTAIFDTVGANDKKIAVTTADGTTQCYVEIERWDNTGEEAVLHVKVPTVATGDNTVLYFYYDNSASDNTTYVGDIGDAAAQNVWDSNFAVVLHMDDASAMVNAVDGSSMTYGGSAAFSLVDGPVAGSKGLEADSDDDYLDVASALNLGSAFTIESQHYLNTGGPNPGYDSLLGKNNYFSVLVDHTSGGTNYWALFMGNGSSWDTAVRSSTELAEETWYSLGVSYSAGSYVYARDGASDGSGSGTSRTMNSDFHIFRREDQTSDYRLHGIITELRISTAVRVPDWMYATQYSLVDNLITFALQDSATAYWESPGWLNPYSQRHKITIPSTNIDAGLDNFPVALHLSSSCGTGTADMTAIFDTIGANSKKLAVTLGDGKTQIPIEIDLWDDTNERAVLHVKVPSVSASETTYLYLYYSADVPDNDEYVGVIGEAPTFLVWDEYSAVYHFAEDPSGTAPQAKDSTVNANHGTSGGTMLTGDYVDGQIGKAWDFDGSDDNFTVPDDDSLDIGAAEDMTIEAVVNADTASASYVIIDNRATSSAGFIFGLHSDNTVHLFLTDSSDTIEPGGDTTLTRDGSTWYYAGGRFDRNGDNDADVWLNAADDVTAPTSASAIGDLTNTATKYFADNAITSSWANFSGKIAEIRIAKLYRSDAWMKATYYTLFDSLVSYDATGEAQTAWLGSWANRIKLTIDSSKIGATLTNFPVAVLLSSASGIYPKDVTDIFTELGSNSLKIAATKDDGVTETYVEVAYWSATDRRAELHVLIPSVSSSVDTVFYLYYDSAQANNTDYVGETGDTAAQYVWDTANYEAVYHMCQNPSGSLLDSTSNGHNGTFYGSMDSNDLVESPKGMALDFDGSDDYITTPNSNLLDPDQYDYTYEAFFKTSKDYSGGMGRIYGDYGVDTDNWIAIDVYTDNKIRLALRDLGGDALQALGVGSDLNDGAWHHSVMARDTLTHMDVYEDGSWSDEETNAAVGNIRADDGSLPTFGRHSSGTDSNYFQGSIGEVRLSYNLARDADWIAATYYTLMDDLVFFSTPTNTNDWPIGWSYRRAFAVPGTNIDATLTDFPITLHLNTSAGTGSADISDIFDEVGDNYKRIAVGDANGRLLPVEVDAWSSSSEVAVLHVKVPRIDADYGALLFLYFNDNQPDQGWAGDTGDYIAQRVWDDNFLAVYHFSDDPSGGTITDSTVNGKDLTALNYESGDRGAGDIGYAITGDTTSERSESSVDCGISGSNPSTFESYSTPETVATAGSIISIGAASSGALRSLQYSTAEITMAYDGGRYGISGTYSDVFRYVVGIFPSGGANASDTELWVNAVDQTVVLVAGADQTVNTTDTHIWVGSNVAETTFYNHTHDELRISDIARSDAYIKATYNTLIDSLGAWGDSETEPVGGEMEIVFGAPPEIEFEPLALTAELYIEMWLESPVLEFEPLPVSATYIGNILRMNEAEGSRPRIASASRQAPGIASASGKRPRLAAAEAFEYQERE